MKQVSSLQRQQRKHGLSATSSFSFAESTRLFAPVTTPSALASSRERQEHWGPYDPRTGLGLLPGECTAPTSLSWEIWTMKEVRPDVWEIDAQVLLEENQWYNTFPG
jgi:hypothetical protein